MRIGFAGTPSFARTILQALVQSEHTVVRAFTQPSRPAGRGRKPTPSPVSQACTTFGVPCFTPTRLRPEVEKFRDLDALVVAAYGLILPKTVLDTPRHGCINVHASLLPRWRGASPVEHAILSGDTETGVSIMQMTTGLDAGPVYRQATLPLSQSSNLTDVTAELASLGAVELLAVLDALNRDKGSDPVPQDESRVTYAPRLETTDERIDWQKTAVEVERHVRAFYGRGMAYAVSNEVNPPLRLKVLDAVVVQASGPPGTTVESPNGLAITCGSDAISLQTVQLNRGKGKPLAIRDALNGFPTVLRAGLRFDP